MNRNLYPLSMLTKNLIP